LGICHTTTPTHHQQTEIGVQRKDPKCRFIYLSGEHSRARLNITRSMLVEILTFHQVMPDYLDHLFIFGLQSEARDLRFSSFREQISLKPSSSAFGISTLGRSGRQYQLCYNLKGMAVESPDAADPMKNEYSIRQAAFYHRFDAVGGNSLWIVTKGGDDISRRFKELTGSKARPEDKSFGNPVECFQSSLSAHLLYCHWSTENWRGYIRWLEFVVDVETKMAVLGPTKKGFHHHVYTAADIQRLLTWQERISEFITIVESNIEIMGSLGRFYTKLGENKDFDIRELCSGDIEVFTNQIGNMMDEFKLHIGRAGALAKLIADRTELVKQHRLERLNHNLEKEAIVMRIVTIVTLIYLPATFVSTFFSTDVIKYQDQDSPGGSYSSVAMNRWLQ
ncbi:hypothetical protein CT0861_10670, partial [Colletotrichum tofieldiae]